MSLKSPTLPLAVLALFAVAFGPSSAHAAAPASPKVQQRIDALLKRRLKPEALPVDLPNPFQVITGNGNLRDFSQDDSNSKGSDDNGGGASGAAVASNVDILSSAVARLKFGGIIVLKDQSKIVINGVSRKEGDMLPADWNNTVVYLKIGRLRPGEVILQYGDASATLKF